jgi:hypothetical protein
VHRIDLILRLAIAVEFVLMASTWRLWFCATDFPRVPLVGLLLNVPVSVVRAASAAFMISLLAAAVSHWRQRDRPGRFVSAATVMLGSLVVLCHQHCLQPWHWLFLLTMTFRVTLSPESLLVVLQRLLACIYIFAAASRFGPEIDAGISRQILVTLLEMAGLKAAAADPQTVSWLCVIAATAEFSTGVLLLLPRVQRMAMVAAVVMHVTLMAALGPTGLNQYATVVIWNGYLAALILLLYSNRLGPRPAARWSVTAATVLCFIWPALALFGVTDNWTGWQLYSPRPEVLHLQIHADAVEELPPSVLSYIEEPSPLNEWCSVRIDQWSLRSAGVPVYPQARFQFAVAAAVSVGVSSQDHVKARITRARSPQWWERQSEEFRGRSELTRAGNRLWLNSRSAASGMGE